MFLRYRFAHKFERSNLDDVVVVRFDENKKPVKVTRREELEAGSFMRLDIGMLIYEEQHCETCSCNGEIVQKMIYPGIDGPNGEGWDSTDLTEAERQWYIEENDKLIKLAEQYLVIKNYLTVYDGR